MAALVGVLMMRFTGSFAGDLAAIDFFGSPFALARFADGERMLLERLPGSTADQLHSSNQLDQFRTRLEEALVADDEGYYLGLGCPCCDFDTWAYLMSKRRVPDERVTSSNLFVNANHARFRERVIQENLLERCAWVVNEKVLPPAAWKGRYYTVPANATSHEWPLDALVAQLCLEVRPILLCAGPASCVIAHQYWRRQDVRQRQVIVDIGSAMDDLFFGRPTRTYHDPRSSLARRVCIGRPEVQTLDFRLLTVSDHSDMRWQAWSRIYEYPYIMNALKNAKVHRVHNVACGQGDLQRDFVSQLAAEGFEVVNSDIEAASPAFDNYCHYDVDQPWPGDPFDAVICVSALHLLSTDPLRAVSNLVRQVKPGGILVLTFDVPGVDFERLRVFLGSKATFLPGDCLTGSNSLNPNVRYRHLSVAAVALRIGGGASRDDQPQATVESVRSVTADITVVLTGYKRPQYLKEQYRAVSEQTARPADILLWQNNGEMPFPSDVLKQCGTASNSRNWGVWARFAYALLARTKYVCVFDDDTMPGCRWFENCLRTMQSHRGLLGTRGLIFRNGTVYNKHIAYGALRNNDAPVRVDIVGHCWFFEREWLGAFWREGPSKWHLRAGEDIHFSHMIQKHLGLNTYVPPHPTNHYEWWGTHPDKSRRYGNDPQAISGQDGTHAMQEALIAAVDGGFRLMRS